MIDLSLSFSVKGLPKDCSETFCLRLLSSTQYFQASLKFVGEAAMLMSCLVRCFLKRSIVLDVLQWFLASSL